MNIDLTVCIPVKTHLKKFIHFIENVEIDKSLDLKNNSPFSYFLSLLFTNKTNIIDDEHSAYTTASRKYTSKLSFTIHARMEKLGCFFLTKKSILVLNRYLHRSFVDHVVQLVDAGVKRGKTQHQVIVEFMDELDIVFDVEYDAVKKAVDRARKNKKYDGIREQKRRSRVNN